MPKRSKRTNRTKRMNKRRTNQTRRINRNKRNRNRRNRTRRGGGEKCYDPASTVAAKGDAGRAGCLYQINRNLSALLKNLGITGSY